ncbi:5979_t:CDS:2, partial [Acaulospora morrowiae]
SKAATKIVSFFEAVTKDLVMNLMKQNEREKLDLTKDLMGEKEREKLDLTNRITKLENDVKDRTELLLRSKGMCNVRGALEFIRSTNRLQDKIISFREPTDNVLTRLTQDERFISYLNQTCSLNNSQYKDVEGCVGGLYYTALKKKLRGHDNDVEIYARDWSVNEVLALGALLRYYNILYYYYDDQGDLAEYPYKLAKYPYKLAEYTYNPAMETTKLATVVMWYDDKIGHRRHVV